MMLKTYRSAIGLSLIMHGCLLVLILWNPHQTQAVLEAHEQDKIPQQMAQAPIQAVAVDAQQIQAEMQKIEQQRQQVKQQELNHQRQLEREAARAKQQKMAEMQHLQELKQQAEVLRKQQQKMQQEAAENLKKLQQQKLVQEKQLLAMKQQQAEAAKKAAQQQATIKAAENLANQRRMAGEVDRYKALILNAIRDRWILPENVDPSLSSQFSIRLAPTGSVLDVHLTRSSGDSLLDRSAQAAIYQASPLPVPSDAATFNMFREISLTVRPSNARG